MAKLNVVLPAVEVEVNGKKYRKVDRDAQAGDIVRITDEDAPDYVVEGGFYEVVRVDSAGDAQIIDEDGDELDLCWYSFDVYEEVAESPTPKYREVKRHAKVGEWIKIVNASFALDYRNGDEFTVISYGERPGIARIIDNAGDRNVVAASEYVVLEPITEPERLGVGDYAKVIGSSNGRTEIGDIVKVVFDDEKSCLPFRLEYLDGSNAGWQDAISLVRATDEEVAAAKAALDPRNKFAKGDKVRLISGGGEHPLLGFENGEIYTVSNPKTLLHSDKRIEIVREHVRHGYAKPDQLEKVSAEELAEIERWSAIGRKVNEFKRGDIVKGTGIHSKEIEIGTVQHLSTTLLGVRTEPDGYSAMDVAEVTLIAPVEQRFDRPEAA